MDPAYSSKIAAKLEQQDTLKRVEKRSTRSPGRSVISYFRPLRPSLKRKSGSVGDVIFSASKAFAFITILAFCSSYLYVVGYQLWAHKPFALYFVPIDYVQLTPIWIVPIFSLATCAGLVAFPVLTFIMYLSGEFEVPERVFVLVLNRYSPFRGTGQLSSKDDLEKLLFDHVKKIGYIDMAMLCVVCSSALISLFLWTLPQLRRIDASLFFFPAIFVGVSILWLFELALKNLNPSKSSAFLIRRLQQNRPLRLAISSVPAFLVGGICAGYFSGPALLQKTQDSRIVYDIEENRPGGIDGRIVFMLSRHVLVLSNGFLVAISNEKVHSIETPAVAGKGADRLLFSVPNERIRLIETPFPPPAGSEPSPTPSPAKESKTATLTHSVLLTVPSELQKPWLEPPLTLMPSPTPTPIGMPAPELTAKPTPRPIRQTPSGHHHAKNGVKSAAQ